MKGLKKVDYDTRLITAKTVFNLFKAAFQMVDDIPKPVRDEAIAKLFDQEALALRALGFMVVDDELVEYKLLELTCNDNVIDIRGLV